MALADAAGVSRQTIYAIESGSFVPNTSVALLLARELGASVEELFGAANLDEGELVIAGCDPAVPLLIRKMEKAGLRLVAEQRNSSQALGLLKAGRVHLAGTHLKDEVGQQFEEKTVAVVSFAIWEVGMVTARKNPKGIHDAGDLSRKDVRMVNREKGSGSRVLLDSQLALYGMDAQAVNGYQTLAAGHLAAAWHVHSGAADCCVAPRAAAQAFRLHFIPLASERYDLVMLRRHLNSAGIQKLLDALSGSGFRKELERLGGYDTRVTGQRVL